jgi:hypothetical protein
MVGYRMQSLRKLDRIVIDKNKYEKKYKYFE